MDNNSTQSTMDLAIGDRVLLKDKNMSGEVIEVREFDGRRTFVVHTEKGNRIVVGARQIEKLD